MAILDVFKRKKKLEAKSQPKIEQKKVSVATKPRLSSGVSWQAYRVLKEPHVTEKATDLLQKNQYVFKVLARTNKIEIKKAVEDTYGIDVVSVRIIKIPKKRRRLGKIEGWRGGYKKAVVKIAQGQKIEVLPR